MTTSRISGRRHIPENDHQFVLRPLLLSQSLHLLWHQAQPKMQAAFLDPKATALHYRSPSILEFLLTLKLPPRLAPQLRGQACMPTSRRRSRPTISFEIPRPWSYRKYTAQSFNPRKHWRVSAATSARPRLRRMRQYTRTRPHHNREVDIFANHAS